MLKHTVLHFYIWLVMSLTYLIYVHCQKIYNLFVGGLETSRQVSLWLPFLSCSAVSANKLHISLYCMYIVLVLQCQKAQNNCQNCLKDQWCLL